MEGLVKLYEMWEITNKNNLLEWNPMVFQVLYSGLEDVAKASVELVSDCYP